MADRDSLVEAAQHAILADKFETDAFPAELLGLPNAPTAVVLRFEGRILGTDTRAVATIAMPAASAADLMRSIIASYSGATAHERDAFGGPLS